MFNNGPQGQYREKSQRPHDQDRADQKDNEGQSRYREASRARWNQFLLGQISGQGQYRNDKEKTPISMANPNVIFSQGVFALNPAKALPLLPTEDE